MERLTGQTQPEPSSARVAAGGHLRHVLLPPGENSPSTAVHCTQAVLETPQPGMQEGHAGGWPSYPSLHTAAAGNDD